MRSISGQFAALPQENGLVDPGIAPLDLFCAVDPFEARCWTAQRCRATLVGMAIKVPMDPVQWRWRRRVLVPVLGAAVRGITRVRRWTTALDRPQLHLIAWRDALDPATAAWIEEAKRSVAVGSAAERAWTPDDLRRLIEERRKLAG